MKSTRLRTGSQCIYVGIGVDLTGILGGTHGGTYHKSPAVEAKKHIFIHCNASNLVLKILQHDKIWGDNPPAPRLRDVLEPPDSGDETCRGVQN